jgi:hypothetical protein
MPSHMWHMWFSRPCFLHFLLDTKIQVVTLIMSLMSCVKQLFCSFSFILIDLFIYSLIFLLSISIFENLVLQCKNNNIIKQFTKFFFNSFNQHIKQKCNSNNVDGYFLTCYLYMNQVAYK